MTRSQLESVLALILNEAEFKDLEVVRAACDRRASDLNSLGRGAADPGRLARSMGESVQQQVGATLDGVREMTRRFVQDLIRKEAPDIPPEDLAQLLAAWVPTPEEKAKQPPPPPRKSAFPPEALRAMVRDFVAYSTGTMSAHRQILLKDEVGDWEPLYWHHFPERVQKLIHIYLNGKIDDETFWQEINHSLSG